MAMSRNRKLVIVGALVAVEVLICVAIVALLAASGLVLPRARFLYVADTRAQETVEESFVPDGPATLDLTNTYGDVRIVAGDGDRFVVKAIKEAWGQNKSEAEANLRAVEVKMTMDGGTLRVEVEDPHREAVVVLGSVRSSQVEFEITAPRQASVSAYTHNGHIALKGSEGDADLTDRYGSITVEDVAGSITADTNNGNVTVRRSGGEGAAVDVRSRYGDITIREVTARELSLDSNNGVLELEEVTVDGDLALNTNYGGIDVGGVRAGSLTVKSHNGTITLNDGQLDGKLDLFSNYGAVSVTRTQASEYKIETRNGDIDLSGGQGSLWLHSNYGDITVQDARDAELDLGSGNGKITFEGSLVAEADHQLESNYGSVTLRLPPDTAFFVDASTNYGRIRCEFDVLVEGGGEDKEDRTTGDELRGTVNGGGGRLRIETRNGDITIEAETFE
jgi:DUF4097 and DUF4098 domain-containing protein YvlB